MVAWGFSFSNCRKIFPKFWEHQVPPPPILPPGPQCLFAKLCTCVQVIKNSSSWHHWCVLWNSNPSLQDTRMSFKYWWSVAIFKQLVDTLYTVRGNIPKMTCFKTLDGLIVLPLDISCSATFLFNFHYHLKRAVRVFHSCWGVQL